MKQPAWTYSTLDKFETCPRQFYRVKVAKDIVEPPTEATMWGTKVHTAFEDYIQDGVVLPEGMTQWNAIARNLAKLPGEKHCEIKYAIDDAFQPAEWGNAWSRGIADLVILHKDHAVVADYKTGKRKPTEQLDLYANYIFIHHPQIHRVTTAFIWLKDKRIDKRIVNRSEAPVIWQGFIPRAKRLTNAYTKDNWPAKPSGLCNGWCPVKDCEFYKPKR